jgi:hypothetical protein
MSKEDAAAVIAPRVGKSSATVRRMLVELFPGKNWPPSGRDESADST